jgi:putative ABC transport system ATP-binding protein
MESKTRITQRPLFYWVLKRHRLIQLLLLIVIIGSLFFRVFPLEMQKRIINKAIHHYSEDLLFYYCALYAVAVVLAGLSKYVINVMQTIIGQRILVEMRTELYHHILQLPLQFYRKMQPGTVISAMTGELNGIGFFLGGALAIPITAVLTFLAFMGFMFSQSFLMGLLAVAVYPAEFFLIPYLQKRYNKLNKKRIKTTRSMANSVNEAVSGIYEIHSNASYTIEEKRFGLYVQRLYDILKRLFIIKYGIKFANNLFQSIGPILLFLVGGYLAINGHFTLGALVAFLSAYEKVYDPWKEMVEYYQALQDAKVRYRQIMEIFDYPPPHPQLPSGRDILRLSGGMIIESADFAVSGGIKLLEDVSLQIQPGEMVALVGSSGSGKSTLALLMAQLYDLSSGSIRYDSHEIGSLCKADISHNITMIAQHPFIFTGTVKENLLYSARSVCDESCELPKDEKLYEIINNVGLENDFLHFGLNMVMAKDETDEHVNKIIQIRQLVREYVHKNFRDDIEFFDVHNFLEHVSLQDNLIFGTNVNDTCPVNVIAEQPGFIRILKQSELDSDLTNFGLEIARASIALLHQKEDFEYHLQTSPMEAKELELYSRMLLSMADEKPKNEKESDSFLLLALRCIPVQHTLVELSQSIKEKIVEARHLFLKEEIGIDTDNCSKQENVHLQSTEDELVQYDEYKDFRPFCPSVYIYNQSLLTNIIFGHFKAGMQKSRLLEKEIIGMLRPAGLLDEIKVQGLDFEVGSKGDRLSGGQQQKIAIARAFLKDTPILIMDEATASLDNTSQAMVQNYLQTSYKGRKTIISVIHRLDLAPSFDRIIVLQEGSVIEQGTYDELLAANGTFCNLVKGETT